MTTFKHTDIGLIPDDWECKSLKDVTIETVTRNPSVFHPDKYIKYVDVSAISNENYKIISDQFVKGSEAPGRARKVLQTNDTIFATIRPTLKRIAKVNSNYNDEYCSTAFCVLRPDQDLINEDFLYYNVLTDLFIEEISKHQSGASYPAVRDDNVKDMAIPLPKIPEQKKIAHVLSKIQQAIETQEQIIKTTQELKKALMQKLFTEGLNGEPQKQTEIGPIPESWEVVTIGDYTFKPQYGFTESAVPTGNVQFLRITDITDKGVDWLNVPYCNCPNEKVDTFLLENNDIVFARIGATTGKSFIVKDPPKSIFASYLIRVRVKNKLDPDYLFAFFNSTSYWKQIEANKGANLKGGFNASLLSGLKIPYPDGMKIQKTVAQVFLELNNKILYHDKHKSFYYDLFKSSLNQLMTGQIRVKDIEFKLEKLEYA